MESAAARWRMLQAAALPVEMILGPLNSAGWSERCSCCRSRRTSASVSDYPCPLMNCFFRDSVLNQQVVYLSALQVQRQLAMVP